MQTLDNVPTAAEWGEELEQAILPPGVDPERLASLPDALSIEEILALDIPPVAFAAGRLMPRPGLVAISGAPGSHKTAFMLYLSLRISAGLDVFTRDKQDPDSPNPGMLGIAPRNDEITRVMFIEEEMSMGQFKERLNGFKRPEGSYIASHVMERYKLKDPTMRYKILQEIKRQNIRMVVFDPFSSVTGIENENDNAEMAKIMDTIREEFIGNGMDLTVVFIHHPAKGMKEETNLRGAGDMLGKVDVHLSLKKDTVDKSIITIGFEKMRLMDETLCENFRIKCVGDSLLHNLEYKFLGTVRAQKEAENDEVKNKIIAAMSDGELWTRKSVSETCEKDSSDNSFRYPWKKMQEAGDIEAVGQKFRLTKALIAPKF